MLVKRRTPLYKGVLFRSQSGGKERIIAETFRSISEFVVYFAAHRREAYSIDCLLPVRLDESKLSIDAYRVRRGVDCHFRTACAASACGFEEAPCDSPSVICLVDKEKTDVAWNAKGDNARRVLAVPAYPHPEFPVRQSPAHCVVIDIIMKLPNPLAAVAGRFEFHKRSLDQLQCVAERGDFQFSNRITGHWAILIVLSGFSL